MLASEASRAKLATSTARVQGKPKTLWDFKPRLIYIGAEGQCCGHDLAQGPEGHEMAQDFFREQGGGLKGLKGKSRQPNKPSYSNTAPEKE